MEDVFKLTGKIIVENAEANKNIDDTTQKAEDAATRISKGFERAGSFLTGIGDKITASGKVMTATLTTGFAGLVGSGIKYNAQMEEFQMNLTTLLGSSEKATKLLSDLKEMAATTPFETTDLIKATETMIGFGIASDDAQKYLGVLGDISMGNSEKLKGLSLAFAQVQSTGKLTGQDLLQMINQGFNPLLYISKMTGKSMATLKEEMSDGAISAQMVADAFAYATQEGQPFYNAMENGATTINGRISTLKDNFQMLVGSLTESLLPTFEKVVNKAIELTEKFNGLSQEQKDQILKWGAIAAAIGPALIVFGKVTSAIGTVSSAIGKFTSLKSVSTVIDGFVKACGGTAGAFGVVAGAVAALVAVFIFLKEHWDKVTETFRNFIENTGLAEKFEEIKSKIEPLVEKFKGLKDLFEVIGGAIVVALLPAIGFLAGAFNGVISALSPLMDAIGGLLDILGGLGTFIKSIFTGDMKAAGDAIKQIGQGIVDVFGGLWEAVKGLLKGFVDGVIGFFTGLWDTLVGHSIVPDTINSIIDWFKQLLGKPIEFVQNMKDKVVNFFGNLKDNAVQKITDLKNKVINIFSNIKTAIQNPIEKARDIVKNAIDKIKGFFNFEFKWPKLKMPHFGIKPKGWKIGDLLEGSTPKLSIDWYAKAVNNPMILDEPTAFGMSPNGNIRVGGETRKEVVAGADTLMNMISNAVATQNESLLDRLEAILRLLINWLPQLANMKMVTDTGVLAGELAPAMDEELGKIKEWKERGR